MIYIVILALAVLGILVCLHIYNSKKTGKPMVCAIGTDCNKVVYSNYNNLFGIDLEIFGILYYGSLAILSALILSGLEKIFIFDLQLIFLLISSVGAFFSVIFLYVQTVLIREWCEYCLISSGLSFIIFALRFWV